jgi:hypothetical protein
LKNDAAGWDQKLQEFELDLNKNQQDVEAIAKDIADCLVVLRTAADRLGRIQGLLPLAAASIAAGNSASGSTRIGLRSKQRERQCSTLVQTRP